MPGEVAVWAGQGSAAGFRYPPPAGRAGRGGAAFVDEVDGDAGQDGLVGEDLQEPADLPLPQPQVVPPPRVQVEHPTRVTHVQHTDPLADRPGHHRVGGLVLGLTHPAPVPALDPPRPTPVLTPPP
ncbi:hypothetical protein [Micromonospora sp. MH33]|uniref:hypothetical protein n=1 Tax=Micromonospora sp. MH33 TaxID=1945509 RepID=UPI001FED4862|nr:hypothetical protein [Micromonospora sp. MH33]